MSGLLERLRGDSSPSGNKGDSPGGEETTDLVKEAIKAMREAKSDEEAVENFRAAIKLELAREKE